MAKKELLNNIDNLESDEKTKEDRIIDYIKSVATIEAAIEPFKEQKKDLKESYESNNWLSKEEMKMAIKALRLLKDDTDLDQLTDFYDTLKKGTGI